MYHGIIQVGNFARPGTYLRSRIEQYDLDKIIHYGRIWRLVYDGVKPDRSDRLRRDPIVPRMNNETAAMLVTHLSHPNGWWRDTAQRLLVLKQDKSVVPALTRRSRAIRRFGEPRRSPAKADLLARFHALWTLEGLGALDAGARAAADGGPGAADAHPGDSRERDALQGGQPIAGRRLQAADEGPERRRRDSGDPDDEPMEGAGGGADDPGDGGRQQGARRAARRHDGADRGRQCRRRTAAGAAARPHARAAERSSSSGATIYNELCFTCHGSDGLGTPKPELGDDDGAAARGIAARQRPPRLHRQGGAARPDRTGRTTRPTRT